MIHLNGHKLCVIDTETTGLRARHHDVIQVCVIALNEKIEPDPNILPFDIKIKPERPENIDPEALRKQSKTGTVASSVLTGLMPTAAADLFDMWFENLQLPLGKRILPLAANWGFDKEFLEDWMGYENFHRIFDSRYRDIVTVAQYINDLCDHQAERVPFGRSKLKDLCNYLKIEFDKFAAHDALYDCMKTAECYKRMLRCSRYIEP